MFLLILYISKIDAYLIYLREAIYKINGIIKSATMTNIAIP